MDHQLHDMRCSNCDKLLARFDGGKVEIKCPRCKTVNAMSGPFDFHPLASREIKITVRSESQDDRKGIN